MTNGQPAYDSRLETTAHIARVRELMLCVIEGLAARAAKHDKSKLESPEKESFDKFTPILKSLTYGSKEYQQVLAEMQVALVHHYGENSHHPEHLANGVDGMTLLDLIEMLCDWKAATERHANGSIKKSLVVNKERFALSDQLVSILENTCVELGIG